jgi:luciferase family oxidoreductase group 1
VPLLSVLDLTPIPAGSTPGEALRASIALAREVEELGYVRHWLAEHHNAGSVASSAPEILIGQIAAATTSIRVGSGGMMLPNHSALKVAELFRVLHALFPGRIDLGLGRAPGTDPRTARALRRPHDAGEQFPAQVDELLAFLEADDAAPRPAFGGTTRAVPIGVPPPDMFVLGSSDFGAPLAARLSLGYAFAHHFAPEDAARELLRYRALFQPSARRASPHAILTVSVVCGRDDDDAERLASSSDLAGVRFAQGIRDTPLPTMEEALAHEWDEVERALRDAHRARTIVGGPAKVGARLRALAGESQADEIMILTHVHDHAARVASYARIKGAFGAGW